MSTAITIVVALLAVSNIVLILLFLKNKKINDAGAISKDETALKLILEQVNEINRNVDSKLTENRKDFDQTIRQQFDDSRRIIKEVTSEIAQVKEASRKFEGYAEQLQSLQDILKNPKQRGVLGEYFLENLLKNVLPPGSYEMQYKFKDGLIVDAVVFVKDKIIPIDSKFSLENYNRLVNEKDLLERERLEKAFKADLKNRIDETAKYVRNAENTMDFAFMFIPHEAIYYDLLVAEVGGMKINTRDLIEYAFKEKRVLIVSPTSFLAFLQTVLQGLKALQIEEKAKDIVKRVEELGRHLKSFEEYHNKMGNALGTVVNQFNLSGKEFKKIDKDVMRITGSEGLGLEIPALEKPELSED